MEPLIKITSHAVVLPEADIDTDIIFPARFLLITEKRGLGRYAFYEKRHQEGVEPPKFPLDRPEAKGAGILITGPNFGCGSSREQAVWALHDLGVRVVIAESFGEIFRSNCFKSGVLPISLPQEAAGRLVAAQVYGAPFVVDLRACTIAALGEPPIHFEIEEWRREALLMGWDDVLIILNTQRAAIAAFEHRRNAEAPWLFEPISLVGLHG